MKISEKDIARAAQELRDEQNQRLHVRPWSRRRRFHIPAWLPAIPAAAIIGFFVGVWTNGQAENKQSLATIVDTVFIKEKAVSTHQDTAVLANKPDAQPSEKKVRRQKPQRQDAPTTIGRPMASDQIRYDLLVKN